MSIYKTFTIKLAYLALVGGFALTSQGCAKKSFEAVSTGPTTQSNGGTTGGDDSGGSTSGGTSGGSTSGGSTSSGTSNGGTTGGCNSGCSTGGSTSGHTSGGSTSGGSTSGGSTSGGTSNGGTSGGSTSGGSTSGGSTSGGSTSGGSTSGGSTSGGSTSGGTSNGGTSGGTTGGCDPFNPHCTHDTKYCVTERYQQTASTIARKLDVWVITDTSTSMDQERQKLADNITTYISQLPSGTDAQFAVTLAHGSTSWFSGRLYKSDFKDPREKYVLSTQELSNSQIRYWMNRKLLYRQKDFSKPAFDSSGNMLANGERSLPLDYDSDGGEAGLLSTWNAIRDYPGEPITRYQSLQRLASDIPGEHNFFREDAALAIIYISDENDICYLDASVADPDNLEVPYRTKWCSGITAEKVAQKLQVLRKSLPLYVSSIIYNNKSKIPTGLENGVGYGYNKMAQLTSGKIIDIADNAIVAGLSSIGSYASQILNLRYDFILKYMNPDPTSIQVKVDNAVKAHTYLSTTNTVHLSDAGGANSLVDIYYCMPINKPLVPYEIQIATHLINTCKKAYQPNVVIQEK